MQTNELTKGMSRVFVYGSLKEGHSNHHVLRGAKYIGRDMILGPFEMVSLGYFPGVLDKGAEADISPIFGEVYEVDREGLAALDLLEGHPDFYCREKMTTENNVRVWMYILQDNGDLYTRVPEGIWQPSADEEEYWNTVATGDEDGSESNESAA